MKQHLIRVGSISFALALLLSSVPVPTYAATSYGSRLSSSDTRKIRALDDDPVEKLPIPILMGLPLSQIRPDFGDPRGGGTREHEGQDLIAPRGAYVVSPTDAVVTSTGTAESPGKYVYTANPGGERFAYMHLDKIEVRRGDVLKPGDLIGLVGNTGNASGGVTHLHFEIRDGREPTDPYPRLTREFTTEERGEALAQIVEDASDEEEEAEKVVAKYRSILIAAQAAGVEFPKELEAELAKAAPGATLVAGSVPFTRDLTLGSQGNDVTALQSFLITENAGPAAQALLAASATGYFGPVTQRALIEYQMKAGIVPASGYFGPLTRAWILSGI